MISNHIKFNRNQPEDFNWAVCDSPDIIDMANMLAAAIIRAMRENTRTLIPGLREALNLIAENTP